MLLLLIIPILQIMTLGPLQTVLEEGSKLGHIALCLDTESSAAPVAVTAVGKAGRQCCVGTSSWSMSLKYPCLALRFSSGVQSSLLLWGLSFEPGKPGTPIFMPTCISICCSGTVFRCAGVFYPKGLRLPSPRRNPSLLCSAQGQVCGRLEWPRGSDSNSSQNVSSFHSSIRPHLHPYLQTCLFC